MLQLFQRMLPLFASTTILLLSLSSLPEAQGAGAGTDKVDVTATTASSQRGFKLTNKNNSRSRIRKGLIRASASKKALSLLELEFHYPDDTLSGCRSSDNAHLMSWTKENENNGYLFRGLDSCCEAHFEEDLDACLEISKQVKTGGKTKKKSASDWDWDWNNGNGNSKGIIVQQRRLSKSGKGDKSGKQSKYYKPPQYQYQQSRPSWQKPPQKKQYSWQNPPPLKKQKQQQQPPQQKPRPPKQQPKKKQQHHNHGPHKQPANSWWSGSGWNSSTKSGKSAKSAKSSKSSKGAYYYPPPIKPRTRDPTAKPTPLPTPRPTLKPTGMPTVYIPTLTPKPTPSPTIDDPVDNDKSVEITMGGLLKALNLNVPPPATEELDTLARVFEKTLLQVLDEGFECDVYSIAGIEVEDDSDNGAESSQGGSMIGPRKGSIGRPNRKNNNKKKKNDKNMFEDRHDRELRYDSSGRYRDGHSTTSITASNSNNNNVLSDILFDLRIIKPCPDCTPTQAVILGARVFDETFDQLDAKAKSGELTVIFCIYAEVAGVVTEPCEVIIASAEGTDLDVQFVGSDPGPTPPVIPSTMKPTMRPVTIEPIPAPTMKPTEMTDDPTPKPSSQPVISTADPTTPQPSLQPGESTPDPTPSSTPVLPDDPTPTPTDPTPKPTAVPVDDLEPTTGPTTYEPSLFSDREPSKSPTASPIGGTNVPTSSTNYPTMVRTTDPTEAKTPSPTTASPVVGTEDPTEESTAYPTTQPTDSTEYPTTNPTDSTDYPTNDPTNDPTLTPETDIPTESPTMAKAPPTSELPTSTPTTAPPTQKPTMSPLPPFPGEGTKSPTEAPTAVSNLEPTVFPTTLKPISALPTKSPNMEPTTEGPTVSPSVGVTTSSPTEGGTTSPPTPEGTLTPVPTIKSDTTPTPPTSLKPSTISPTSLPEGAEYFTSFEKGSFFWYAEWSTGGDGDWTFSKERATSGVYSIKSPDLTNQAMTGKNANVTLVTNPGWGAGTLEFSILAGVSMPIDTLLIYVDGQQERLLAEMTSFRRESIELSAGEHAVTWSYVYNPVKMPQLPPGNPEIVNAVFLDDVTFLMEGYTMPPTQQVTVKEVTSSPTPKVVTSSSPTPKEGTSTDEPTQAPSSGGTTSPPTLEGTSTPVPTIKSTTGGETDPPTLEGTSTDGPTQTSSEETGSPTPGGTSTPVPTIESNVTTIPPTASETSYAPSTISPTSLPEGAEYFTSFEKGSFFWYAEWSTEGDGNWTFSKERAVSGVYSIKSPDLTNEDFLSKSANVTLVTNPGWGAGTLEFSILAGVNMPVDAVQMYVDGKQVQLLAAGMTSFRREYIELDAGQHDVTWSYMYNPANMPDVPEEGPEMASAVFLDDVTFLMKGYTMPPTQQVTSIPGEDTASPSLSSVPTAVQSGVPESASPTASSVPTIGQGSGVPTLSSIAPTTVPPGAIYYTGFEKGSLAQYPEWTTEGDGVWASTTERANGGVYSIASPDLANDDLVAKSSNVTLTTEDWGEGTLVYSVFAGVNMPFDALLLYVDGEPRGQLQEMTNFESRQINLGPGPHTIEFSYNWNPLNLQDGLPPTSPSRIGRGYIDDVYFLPAGVTIAPTGSPVAVVETMEPTLSPVGQGQPSSALPTLLQSVAPTTVPPGATYYNSFEKGTFPDDPEWSTTTDSADFTWELTDEQARSGVFSIQSPDLSNVELTPGNANATLTTGEDWGPGTLVFSILAGVNMPHDALLIYVDGMLRLTLAYKTAWEMQQIQLSPGPHEIVFSYEYNPEGLDGFPPESEDRIGAVFVDDVYFLPSGLTVAPTEPPVSGPIGSLSPTVSSSPTSGGTGSPTPFGDTTLPTPAAIPSTVSPTSLPPGAIYYDGFEQGTFPADSDWSVTGDGEWALNTEQVKSGVYSIKSPDFMDPADMTSKVANVTLTTGVDWPAGNLVYSILSGVVMPYDDLLLYVDGEMRGQAAGVIEWESRTLQLSPGEHTVTWSYKYNPMELDAFPPIPLNRIGATVLDDVYFLPEGVSIAPTPSVASGTTVPTLSDVPTSMQVGIPVPPTDTPTIFSAEEPSDPPTFFPTNSPVAIGTGTTAPNGPGESPTFSPSFFPSYNPTKAPAMEGVTESPAVESPTASPIIEAGGPTTISPTSFPPDAIYYDGFEQGTFPDDPEWTTSGDGIWELTTEKANSGVYSIRSPDLTAFRSGNSNVTLSLGDPDFGGGSLILSVLASVELPIDIMAYYLDGEMLGQMAPQYQFETLEIPLEPGPHVVTFQYRHNPFDLDQSPPPLSSEHTGAVYIDDVHVVTYADTFFDGFETGDFTGLDWKTSGEQTWMVDETNPYESMYSAHVRSEDISSSGNYSQLDLDVTLGSAAFVQFYFYAPVSMPFESFDLRVDGQFLTGMSTEDETWTQAGAILSSGPHTVSWRLAKNPGGAPEELLETIPSPDYRTGEAWLDNIQLLPATPSFVEIWESGDFNANPWVLTGDAAWSISDEIRYEGTYSATIASEDIEEGSGTSELSIDIITEDGGQLEFQVLPSIEGPFEIANVLIDDIVVITYSSVADDWQTGNLDIQPGKRKVTFQLLKNPGGVPADLIDELPGPDNRQGRLWLDGIVFTATGASASS